MAPAGLYAPVTVQPGWPLAIPFAWCIPPPALLTAASSSLKIQCRCHLLSEVFLGLCVFHILSSLKYLVYFCPLSAFLHCSRLRALDGPCPPQHYLVNRCTRDRLPMRLTSGVRPLPWGRRPQLVIQGVRQHGLRPAPWPRATLLLSLYPLF